MLATEYAYQNAKALGIRPKRLEMLEDMLKGFIERDWRQAIVLKVTRNGHTIFESCHGTNTKPYGLKTDTIFPYAQLQSLLPQHC